MSCWADGRGMQSGYVWGYMHCDEEVVLQALAKAHQSSINRQSLQHSEPAACHIQYDLLLQRASGSSVGP